MGSRAGTADTAYRALPADRTRERSDRWRELIPARSGGQGARRLWRHWPGDRGDRTFRFFSLTRSPGQSNSRQTSVRATSSRHQVDGGLRLHSRVHEIPGTRVRLAHYLAWNRTMANKNAL